MTAREAERRSVSPSDIQAIIRGRHGNPFAVLGMHGGMGEPLTVNVFAPQAAAVTVLYRDNAGRWRAMELAVVPHRT